MSDQLIIRHWVATTPDVVWHAFTTPEVFHRFFSPEGLHIPLESVVIEPWAGGRFECTMVFDDTGVESPNIGRLSVVEPPHRLVGEEPSIGFRSTQTFTPEAGGTLITVVQEGLPSELVRNPEVVSAFRSSYRKLGRVLDVATEERPCGVLTVDDHGRPEPPVDAGEVAAALGFLDYQRATLEWKVRGLGAAGLAATTAASTMTLGGILKHMAFVEDHWFSWFLHDAPKAEPWASVDWDADHDWEFHSASHDTPEQLRELWNSSVARSRELVTQALPNGGFDQFAKRSWPNGDAPNLRWIVLHMIEEYARHNGHADLLRESVDGETGE
ncbi:MAG: hypothetical protein RI900_693 [Actinomycetota bacterium]